MHSFLALSKQKLPTRLHEDPEFIVQLLDRMTKHSARNWLKAFRHFFKWCEDRKLIRHDPTWGIKIKMPKSNGHHTFTEAEIAQYQARHSIGSKARLALAIGIFTGLRREDATRLGRAQCSHSSGRWHQERSSWHNIPRQPARGSWLCARQDLRLCDWPAAPAKGLCRLPTGSAGRAPTACSAGIPA